MKNKAILKKVLMGTLGVALVVGGVFLAKSTLPKGEVYSIDIKEFYLNEDKIGMSVTEEKSSSEYKFVFSNEKYEDVVLNVSKEIVNLENISEVEDINEYFAKINYPINKYLIDFYLKRIENLKSDEEIHLAKASYSMEEKKKGEYELTVTTKNEKSFKFDIKLDKDSTIKVTYKDKESTNNIENKEDKEDKKTNKN